MKQTASQEPGKIKSFFDNYKALKLIFLVLLTQYASAQVLPRLDTIHARSPIGANPGYSYTSLQALKLLLPPTDTLTKASIRDTGAIVSFKGTLFVWSAKSGVLRWDTAKAQGGAGGGFTPPGDNTKVLDGTGAAINPKSLPTTTSDSLRLKDSTAAARALANSKVPQSRIISINGQSQDLSTDPSFSVTATAAPSPWYTIPKVSGSYTVNGLNGASQKIILDSIRPVTFSNFKDGQQITLDIIHSVAGSKLTGLPNVNFFPEFYFGIAANDVTDIKIKYDSALALYNYTTDIRTPPRTGAAPTPTYNVMYGGHLQLSEVNNVPSLSDYCQGLVDMGMNFVQLFADVYNANAQNYPADHVTVMNALNAKGIKVMSQINQDALIGEQTAMAIASFNNPSIYKIGGKPVFCIYYGRSDGYTNFVNAMTSAGWARSSYLLFGSPFYPHYTGSSWVENYSSGPESAASIQHWLDYGYDGIVPFSGDKGNTDEQFINNIIFEDTAGARICATSGKLFMAGIGAHYYNDNTQQTETGFTGLNRICSALAGINPAYRPLGVCWCTLADFGEESSVGPQPGIITNNATYYPPVSASFVKNYILNFNPVADRTGASWFILPWIAALRTGATTPTVTSESIMAWYSIHPRSVAITHTIPAPYNSNPSVYTQSLWDGSHFANIPPWVAQGKYPSFDSIEVAVHLTSPAKIKINSTLSSTTYPAGIATFKIAQALGTPTFSINRGGVDVITTSGAAITNSVIPGGFQRYIIKTYP